MMSVNYDYKENLTPEKLKVIINELRNNSKWVRYGI
jgi:NADH:ubiquinone oxidoreductase subunit E